MIRSGVRNFSSGRTYRPSKPVTPESVRKAEEDWQRILRQRAESTHDIQIFGWWWFECRRLFRP